MRKVLFVLAGLLISCFNLYSQVHIKEKVEIEPTVELTSSLTGDVYLPCGPYKPNTEYNHFWQVVWGGYFGPLDPMQQLFGLQSGENYPYYYFVNPENAYVLKPVKGITYFTLREKIQVDDDWYMWQDKPWSDSLIISGSDMVGEGTMVPYDCVFRYMDQKYQIRYNNTPDRDVEVVYSLSIGDSTRYYHTLIKKRGFIFNTPDEPYVIPHGEKFSLSINPVGLLCTPSGPTPEGCTGYDDIKAGGGIPPYSAYNASIIEGNQYGTLSYRDVNQNLIMNDTLSNLNDQEYITLKYEANGDEPQDTAYVIVHFECTEITPVDVSIMVIPNKTYPLKIQFNPPILAPGEIADIMLLKRYGEYSIDHPETVKYGDFASDQRYNVKITRGAEYGTLISSDGLEISDKLENTLTGFKFIAVDSIDMNSASIDIEVNSLEYGGIATKSIKNKDTNKKTSIALQNQNIPIIVNKQNIVMSSENIIIPADLGTPIMGIGKTSIVKNNLDILLGESKYFQAKYNESGQLVIEELDNSYPERDGGIENVVWEVNSSKGDKLGVYWETEKPIPESVRILSKGLIRIIGRYWEEEKIFKVSLTARDFNNTTSLFLTVKKPEFLYSSAYNGVSYFKSKDVHDIEYSVDDLCISIGGKYGIPPQFIKGHMAKESAKKNFGSYSGFAPYYRYEPFTTQFNSAVNYEIREGNPFIVKENSMGSPGALGVPTQSEHKHVLFIHYPESPITIWDIVNANSQLTNPNNPSTFGYRYKDGEKAGQVRSGYSIYGEYSKVFLPAAEKEIRIKYSINPDKRLDINEQVEANNLARERFVNFLKNDWNGGLNNSYAQTRVAASYGLLQNLYTTALSEGLSKDNSSRPELLNEPQGFIYNIYHYISLCERNGFSMSSSNNWVSSFKNKAYGSAKPGFEEGLKVIAYLWNPGEKDINSKKPVYHIGVFNNMKNFLPGVTK